MMHDMHSQKIFCLIVFACSPLRALCHAQARTLEAKKGGL